MHSVAVSPKLSRADTQQYVLNFGVFAIDVVRIAGSNQRNSDPIGDFDGARHLLALDLEFVVHDLDKESITEHTLKPLCYVDRFLDCCVRVVTFEDSPRELT